MKAIATAFDDVWIVETVRHGDDRGYFSETYNKQVFASAGIECEFVQDNHSLSRASGTIRGLHFQLPPFAQDKLVRVLRGSILDVAVDLRKNSPTYGRHLAVTLRADEPRQLLVPIGFAHGFCTLEPNTEVVYKVSNFYSPKHDRGLRWNDPALGIDWPFAADSVALSPKDRQLPDLGEIETPF